MGLSNEERFTKLAYSTRALTNKGRELPEEQKYLKSLLEGLWPALLRQERNTAFWILGGSGEKDTVSQTSLLGLALLHHKPEPKDEFESEGGRDAYQSYALESLSMERLLNERQHPSGPIYEILLWTEAASYSLRRYNDEMAKSLREYDDILCRIQGECFNLLVENGNDLLEAWLQAKIITKLLTWAQDDIVNTWWAKQNLHHDMRLLEYPFRIEAPRLLEIYKEVQFKKPNLTQRILWTIEIAGPRWHYAHQHKAALALFEEHNKKPGVEKINLKAVKAAIPKCVKVYEERQKSFTAHYRNNRYCALTGQFDEIEEETPAPKKKLATKKPKPRKKTKKAKKKTQ